MNLVNKEVKHKVFGEGIIIRYDDSYVEICFPAEPSQNVRFVFPDAFGTYLTLIDQKAANWVGKMVQTRKEEQREEEVRLKKIKALQEKRRQELLKRERLARRRTRRIHPSSQSVFWCETGEEDSVFTEWNIFTGAIKSGQKKGQPRRLARIRPNSACLLTARASDMPEKNRRILGAFMVREDFDPKHCKDGYIPAHPEYRLRLSEQESKKMLFWNYYFNERHPLKTTWNTGRHRYFNNTWMAKILKDIISLKKKPREREFVKLFFEYFCQMNRINMNKLPKPDGALVRIDQAKGDE